MPAQNRRRSDAPSDADGPRGRPSVHSSTRRRASPRRSSPPRSVPPSVRERLTDAQALAVLEDMSAPSTATVRIGVAGMTCQSCVGAVSDALSLLPGVAQHSVSLAENAATVSFDSGLISVSDVLEAVRDRGFEAFYPADEHFAAVSPTSAIHTATTIATPNPQQAAATSLSVKGMTCNSCVQTVTGVLLALDGVVDATVSLATESATVHFNPSLVSSAQIAEAVNDCGFDAAVAQPSSQSELAAASLKPSDSSLFSNSNSVATVRTLSPLQPTTSEPPISMRPPSQSSNDGATKTCILEIQGMTCYSCVASIERHLNAQPGITSCKVALSLGRADVEYIDKVLSEQAIADMVNDIGFEARAVPQSEIGAVDLSIFGMTCASCSSKIEREISKLPGIRRVAVNLLGQSGRFEFEKREIGVRDIVRKIESLGFNAIIAESTSNAQTESLARTKEIRLWRNMFWRSVALSLPIMAIIMVGPSIAPNLLNAQLIFRGLHVSDAIVIALTIPLQFIVGSRFYKAAFKTIRHGSYTMDVLVALGTTLAFGFSVLAVLTDIFFGTDSCRKHVFFETSPSLITFVSLGRYLENVAKAKTGSALSKLISLAPAHALLLEPDPNMSGQHIERKIPCEYIQLGDLLKIIPGERIPADGIIEFGSTNIDESLVTGEPLPVSKHVGDKVVTGTVNTAGVVHVRADRVGSDTTLAQIIKLVSDAQSSKAPIQDLADKIAGVFVPSVVILGVLTFLTWMCVIHLTHWIPKSFPGDSNPIFVCLSMCISVIVVACPCALGLATPTAIMVGTGIGARLGILIKGGAPLETAYRVSKVIFDKTGTLTVGKMNVVAVDTWSTSIQMTETEFLAIVGAAESNSEHPLGRSIADHAHTRLVSLIKGSGRASVFVFPDKILEFESVTGSGISCKVVGPNTRGMSRQLHIGSARFVTQQGAVIDQAVSAAKSRHESQGRTVIFVAMDGVLVGMVALADVLKPEAASVVAALRRMKIDVAMVTGDQELTARAIARSCGITEVHAGTSPAGKKQLVEEFQESGHVVAMVGDGINDSASLAQSDMGIAVYGGTDVAVEAANVVLMRPDLTDVVTAIDLSRTIFQRIWINFAWASIYNVFMVPLAMGMGAPWGLTLPAVFSGMAMSMSSVSVVASSLLLRLYRKPIINATGSVIGYETIDKDQIETNEATWIPRMSMDSKLSSVESGEIGVHRSMTDSDDNDDDNPKPFSWINRSPKHYIELDTMNRDSNSTIDIKTVSVPHSIDDTETDHAAPQFPRRRNSSASLRRLTPSIWNTFGKVNFGVTGYSPLDTGSAISKEDTKTLPLHRI